MCRAHGRAGTFLPHLWVNAQSVPRFYPNAVTLAPDDTGGVFDIRLDGKLLWSRKEHGRFPDIKELKQLVRDHVAPERGLGHSDAKAAQS